MHLFFATSWMLSILSRLIVMAEREVVARACSSVSGLHLHLVVCLEGFASILDGNTLLLTRMQGRRRKGRKG